MFVNQTAGEDWRLALVLNMPCPGTAMIAVEGAGETVGVSISLYVYCPDREAIVERDMPMWRTWLEANSGLDARERTADESAQ